MNWSEVFNKESFIWNRLSKEINLENKSLDEIAFLLHKSIFEIDKDSFNLYLNWLVELLDLKTNDRLIEIGCGNGSLLLGMNQKVKIKPYGLDISKPLIEVCQRIYPNLRQNFSVGTYPNNKYEKCLCNSVLQYLDEESVEKIIRETKCQKIVLSDVKNILCEDIFKYDQAKRQGLTLEERNRKYENTPLKHYSKDFFKSFEFDVEIKPMPDFYPDSKYKSFAVVIDKKNIN